jgi:LuxR family maltose regulon positive regulatory protein
VISYSYGYNLAEYEILFGDKTKGIEIVGELANSGYVNSVLPLDRLLTDLLAQNVTVPNITSRFMEEYRSSDTDKKSLPSQLLYARLLWESGDTDTALEAVDSILTFSRENKNKLRLVESGLLKIHMLVSQGGEHRRMTENLLREAIYYAWENRILQPFFVERKCVVPLIKEYLKTGSDLNLEQRKFMFDMMNLCVDERQASVKDILSARELEVLGELSKGLTNNEIAARLCISLATVKTHIINIDGKLGVSSRLSAVEGAKSRGLL